MRTYTDSNFTIEYPDEVVRVDDLNYCRLRYTGLGRGVTVSFSVNVGGRTLQYTTDKSYTVIIDISNALKLSSYGDVALSFRGTAYGSDIAHNVTTSASIVLTRGRTLAEWIPASGRTVYVPDAIGAVEIPVTASAVIDNTAANIGINTRSTRNQSVITVKYAAQREFGNRYAPEIDRMTTFGIRHIDCLPDNGAILAWYDTDGCKRYAPCKVVQNESNSESASYNPTIAPIPSVGRHVYGAHESITLYFDSIEPSVRLHEIAYSESVRLLTLGNAVRFDNGLELRPDFDALSLRPDKAQNYTLKFWLS